MTRIAETQLGFADLELLGIPVDENRHSVGM